jgi:lipopolysaccharide/colanic/teichoic acid biosynthesis glycosyltransferase
VGEEKIMEKKEELSVRIYQQELSSKKRVEVSYIYKICKRAMDVILAGARLIILSPVFLVVIIAIKAEDKFKKSSSSFFSQKRVGKNGKEFKIYKFRSMIMDAEKQLETLLHHNEIEGAMFKMKEDPRVTKVGKFIRSTSIDELPQLWNVVKGDMSLVGPRPPLPQEVEKYMAHHKKRLLVKPGCSGLWQISGRNNVHFEEMVEMDLAYIRNQSIKQDLLIIAGTIKIIVLSVFHKIFRNCEHDNGAY